MMRRVITGAIMISAAAVMAADVVETKSRVESIGLFKNGLAVVRRVVDVPGIGEYQIKDVPEPVHGTFWVESYAKVVTKVTVRDVEEPADRKNMTLTESFAGMNVVVHLRGENAPIVKGKVLADDKGSKQKEWNRRYQQPQNWWLYGYSSQADFNRMNNMRAENARFITLKTDTGITYLDSSQILYIDANGVNTKVKRRKPVMVFSVKECPKGGTKIVISYLAKGISWAPSYRLELNSEKSLTVAQKAVIKNEFGALEETEVKLISGFPNVKFAHVSSPLTLTNSWSSFFQQLNTRYGQENDMLGNVMTQQAVMYNRPSSRSSGLDLSSTSSKDGTDIHYESVGKMSMAEGDSLAFQVASAKTEYERLVEWIIPDTRNEYGRYIDEYQRRNSNGRYDDSAWDSIRFKNPFKFPMTTAAAMITGKGRFLGESLSYWVNPGQETVLHITKALSISTRNTEQEVNGKRETVHIGGHNYQKCTVKGTLSLASHRDKAAKLLIRRRFSGKLVNADEKPECTLRQEGVYSVNERNELIWELSIGAGENKEISYTYSVLVRR